MGQLFTPALPYLPVVLLTLFLNTADIYFLQSESKPRLYRALSFWFYLLGQVLVALLAAFFLYEKAGLPKNDWPIAAIVAGLSGFSILQSLTLKFGDKGIDARELFDAWKRRVIQDVSQANTSEKRAQQMKVARALAKKSAATPGLLEPAIYQLAQSVQLDPAKIIEDVKKSGLDTDLMMAQWIVSIDLEYALNLARSTD